MKILITGSSGFVGSHLVKKLLGKHQLVKYDLKNGKDVLDEELLIKNLKGADLVIHLAAFISATESWEKPSEYLNNNALGTLSVVKNSVKSGVKKIIFFSSAAVKARPLTPYAVSKISAEEILKLYQDKINTVIVRPENIYGPGQKEAYGYVIHNFIKASLGKKPIVIYGKGDQTRDFIYVDDVVNTVEKLISKDIKTGTVISLGTGTATSVLNLAKTVIKITGKNTDINFVEKRREPKKSVADTKTLSKIGVEWKKFEMLGSGIKKLLTLQSK